MKLTPLDIHHKEFRNSLRGYNPEEVDDFLDEVADEFERLFKENIDLSEANDAAQEKLRNYSELERTLQKTLVAAQTSAEDIVRRAEVEAERLLKEAESKAQEIVTTALEDKQHAQAENERLHAAEGEFRARFRALLDNYSAMLGSDAPVAAAPVVDVVDADEASELLEETGNFGAVEIDDEPEVEDDVAATVVSLQLGEIGDDPVVDDEFPELDVPEDFPLPKAGPVGELDDEIEEID